MLIKLIKNNKVLSILAILFSLFVLVSYLYITNFYKDLQAITYLSLCLAPLIIIGFCGTTKLNSLIEKIILWTMLLIVFCLICLHSGIKSWDYKIYLLNWYNAYANLSLKNALYKIIDISNYTPVYNYILIVFAKLNLNPLLSIKYVTYMSSFLLAFSLEQIISYIKGDDFNFLRFVFALLLPPVLIEYTAWGQCDTIYTSFALLSFYFALNKKSKLSFIFIGLSFAFKLQFLFIVPILFIMLICKDKKGEHYLKWKDIWIAPLPYLINLIPALAGRSVIELLLVYLSQSKYDNRLSGNCANIGVCIQELGLSFADSNITFVALIIITLVLMALLLVFIFKYNNKEHLKKVDFVFFGMVFSFIMVFFMPKMLDRFYFIAMSFAFVYFFVQPSRASFLNLILTIFSLYFMMIMQLVSLFSAIFGTIAVLSAASNIGVITYTIYKNYYQPLFKISKNEISNTKTAK